MRGVHHGNNDATQKKKEEERWNITQEAEDRWKESDNRRQWGDKHARAASRQTKEQLGLTCLGVVSESEREILPNTGEERGRALELHQLAQKTNHGVVTDRRIVDGSESCATTRQGCQYGDFHGSSTKEERCRC